MRSDEEWAVILSEKAAGTSVDELAKKFNVSTAAIYQRFNRGSKRKVKVSSNGHRPNGDYAQVIADLTERRDKLNAAILALEEVSAA